MAQYEEKDFVRYTVKEGLSNNYITSLQQDGLGYIWIGTDLGLNRFDGNTFKKFYQGSPELPLPSGIIRNLKRFGPNHLGILTNYGFQLLNTADLSHHNYIIADSTAFITQVNSAWDAARLPDGSFAVTTGAGFYHFREDGKLLFRHDVYTLKDVGNKRILYGREIFTVGDKEFLVYTENFGLALYHAGKKSFTPIDASEKKWEGFLHPAIIPGDNWIMKHQLNDHQFFFVPFHENHILFYDHRLKKTTISTLPFSTSLELSWESRTEMLNDSVFAINGKNSGFYLFTVDRRTGAVTCDGVKRMAGYKVNRLFLDKDRRLWAGTSTGLLQQKLNSPPISSYRYPSPANQMESAGFMSVMKYKNKLYAARFSQNNGLVIINPETMKEERTIGFFGENNSWNEILSIELYHPDTLWIGTSNGLLWFDTKTERYGKLLDEKKYPWAKNILAVLAPPRDDGYAWFCSFLGGAVVRYHIPTRTFTVFTSQTKPALPFNKVKSIAYDAYGDVWIGGHSLARWNNRQQLFDTLINVYGGVNKFSDDILTFSADTTGSLWLHNANNNLLEYRIKEKKFIAYTSNEGLPPDEIQSMSPVTGNDLWIGSNNYLAKFDIASKKATLYDESDGLPGQKPTGRKIYFDPKSGNLYLCSNDYLVKFPSRFESDHSRSSGLMILELKLNDKNILYPAANELYLDHNENNLTLTYTIIDFEKSNYQFAYRLDHTGNWNSLGTQRSLTLTNLQPGKYLIQIKATGRSGDEKIKEMTVIIRPPLWKKPWFLIACALFIAAIIYYMYRNRVKQVRQHANIDRLLAQTEMKALHAQMNPHFIFNSLNSIREMILNNENKEASHFLGKFAHLIRMTLDQSGESFISLRKTIEYLHRYIEMEQIRNSHFTCRILADDELEPDETFLPPMLIQPFIENAIWHGTTGSRKDININIDFKKENNDLVCIIDDNGIGIDQSLHQRKDESAIHKPVGITNIETRIRLLNEKYRMRCSLSIKDKSGLEGYTAPGTLVVLRLPLEITGNE